MTRFDDLYSRFGVPALEHTFGETVTFRARRTNSVGNAWEYDLMGITARRREQFIQNQPLGFVSQETAPLIWDIAASVFTAEQLTPQRGDAIEDEAGNLWRIDSIKQTGLQADYEFTCQLESAAED